MNSRDFGAIIIAFAILIAILLLLTTNYAAAILIGAIGGMIGGFLTRSGKRR